MTRLELELASEPKFPDVIQRWEGDPGLWYGGVKDRLEVRRPAALRLRGRRGR